MNCLHCNKDITVSWLHLTNLPDLPDLLTPEMSVGSNMRVKDKHICGYSCYKRLSDSNMLPRSLWSHIVNKEDYTGLIRPVTTVQLRKFEYLTVHEINQLNDIEKEEYFMTKEEQIEIDPLMKQIRDDIDLEDERTSHIEEYSSGSGSDQNDDY